MVRNKKIITTIIVSLIAAMTILVVISAIVEPRVSAIFMERAKGSLNARIEVRNIHFSLLRSFPRASVELQDITLISPGQSNDTLLAAGRVSVSLKILALLRKEYVIDRLSIENANLNISGATDWNENPLFFKREDRMDSSMVNLDIRNVRVLNSQFRYSNSTSSIITDLEINSATSRLVISPSGSRVDFIGNIEINSLVLNKFTMPRLTEKIKITANFTTNRSVIEFDRVTIASDQLDFSAEGSFKKDEHILSINYDISPLSAGYILSFPGMPAMESIGDYDISGIVSARGSINGEWNSDKKPDINTLFRIEKGSFSLPGKDAVIKGIRGNGSLLINPANPARSFALTFDPFSAEVSGSAVTGSLSLKDIGNPLVDFRTSGDVRASTIISLTGNPGFDASGIIRTNLRLFGRIPGNVKFSVKSLADLNRSINLNLKSLDISVQKNGVKLENVKGNIMVANNIWFDGITFKFEGSDMAMNGRVTGFDRWLGNNSETLLLTAGLWSSRFDYAIIEQFKQASARNIKEQESKGPVAKLALNLDIKLDSLVIGNFRASMFSGAINYSENFVNISSFSLSSLKGTLEGNVALARLSSGHYLGKGWFDIGKIDIKETFSVFNNFRQSYITHENLGGRLTGNLSITSELDSLFKPVGSTIVATGNYSITDGELVDFEPIMALSRFVELTELRDIRFSELKNNLDIRNRAITIPSMDINSTAFEISLSGNHSFEGIYDYHLKLLLSDLLSKKAIKNNSEIDEFGVIEADGLGKTSLYLKIEGDKNGSKVSYDMKNLKVDLKNDMKEEKGTLKSILREEYGWYSGDTIAPPRKEETRKFRITWEEADSIRTDDAQNEEKALPLKNLLRKKKKGGEG